MIRKPFELSFLVTLQQSFCALDDIYVESTVDNITWEVHFRVGRYYGCPRPCNGSARLTPFRGAVGSSVAANWRGSVSVICQEASPQWEGAESKVNP